MVFITIVTGAHELLEPYSKPSQTFSKHSNEDMICWLVVWNMFYFSIQLGIIIPNWLTPSFLRGVGIPPTRYGLIMFNMILIWFNILYILYITNQFAFILKSSDNGMFVADPGASELWVGQFLFTAASWALRKSSKSSKKHRQLPWIDRLI